ncbi:hypothetical protein [Caldisalinibacter kiritimatiensis]|uniref:NOMO second beta-sandwich domain-containing protein n=1 Tax=Caldisalinibacter kiritimatiensis TaxID=1304284 RepID=R1CHU1_9FIRM|nr:hypothetical protein [Caldisalinibacter kiritimatiensis]EOD01855.1 hypothetical protein L21TH_0061 [Caldisalinibacter kiritimatiensis]
MKRGDFISYYNRISKYIIISITALFLLLFTPIYTSSAKDTLPNTVTIGPYINHYNTLKEALENVSDGGTIEILYKSQPYVFSETTINKNVTIIGLSNNGKLPVIHFKEATNPCIDVESPNFFSIKNLILKSQFSRPLIQTNTSNINMDNVITYYSIPVVLKDSLNSTPLNITIKNSTFNNDVPRIQLTNEVSGNISFTDNTFHNTSLTIKNNGANINMDNNNFIDSGIISEENNIGMVSIYNNSFEGSRCTVNSYTSKNLSFHSNSFTSDTYRIYNNDLSHTLNLNNNWWGSINGPYGSDSTIDFQGNIIYENWALNEECTEFVNDLITPIEQSEISGTATLKNSSNHQDIRVDLFRNKEKLSSTYTDVNGAFNFNNIEPNVYTLSFEYPKYKAIIKEINVNTESYNVNVELEYTDNLFDINSDCTISNEDLSRIINCFSYSIGNHNWDSKCDLNRNDLIDIFDLIIFLRYEGE